MKNRFLKIFLLHSIICLSGFTSFGNSSFYPQQQNEGNDTIEVHGKFISPCVFLDKVKIRKYNVMGGNYEDVPVTKSGEFSYQLFISGPQQVSIRIDKIHLEFIVTPKEKAYNIEITCYNNKQQKIEVKNSYENQAFSQLYNLSKTLRDSLEKLSKFNHEKKDTFRIIKKLFLDYQGKVSSISKSNPESFTGSVLCSSEILPKSAFASINALRENYLRREVFSNPQFYNNFLSTRVFTNYLFLMDKKDTSFIPFNNVLSVAIKNPVSAKLLQQIFYDLFYYQHRESFLVTYIKWAKVHANDMANQVVKLQLKNMENCMAGSSFTNIQLNDPTGVTRSLSEVVASGKLTLLIFYSPTCTHCEENLPKLLPIWNQYKSKGLKIYAVGYDGTNEQWNDFIKTKSTSEWTNVFEFENGSRPTVQYVINYTPTFILIDQQGKIITRFADLDYLFKEIPKRLN